MREDPLSLSPENAMWQRKLQTGDGPVPHGSSSTAFYFYLMGKAKREAERQKQGGGGGPSRDWTRPTPGWVSMWGDPRT